MTRYLTSLIFTLIFTVNYIFAQSYPRSQSQKNNDQIRQYIFSSYTMAAANSDSIIILSYLIVPNNVLQFIKSEEGFNASYEATISLKEKNGNIVDRKNWSNFLKTKNYLESTSKKISTIHFYQFKVAPGSYIVSGELIDKDSKNNGIKNKDLKLKNYNGDLILYKPFLIDYLPGKWGLDDNEIPLIQNTLKEEVNQSTLFVSGKVQPGPYTLEVIVKNSNKKKIWGKIFQASADKNIFYKRIIIPEEVVTKGLRKKVELVLSQNNKKKKNSIIFGVSRAGFSKSIGNFSQAVLAMRYILKDNEWKKLRKAKSENQESVFLEYWAKQDPTPNTPENELQDEYFSRVSYANSSFKGSMDGWRTHMGEIYIKFGRPDDIEETSDPLSRIYYQRWHYYKINKYFDFVDESGFGDFRLTSPFMGNNNW